MLHCTCHVSNGVTSVICRCVPRGPSSGCCGVLHHRALAAGLLLPGGVLNSPLFHFVWLSVQPLQAHSHYVILIRAELKCNTAKT
jgi:hypothetical protein